MRASCAVHLSHYLIILVAFGNGLIEVIYFTPLLQFIKILRCYHCNVLRFHVVVLKARNT